MQEPKFKLECVDCGRKGILKAEMPNVETDIYAFFHKGTKNTKPRIMIVCAGCGSTFEYPIEWFGDYLKRLEYSYVSTTGLP